jgi:hypothetical protein
MLRIIPRILRVAVGVVPPAQIAATALAETISVVCWRRVRYAHGGADVCVAEVVSLFIAALVCEILQSRYLYETHQFFEFGHGDAHAVVEHEVVARTRGALDGVV